MANAKNELTKAEKKVRRLYALVWLLACPLAFVLATLLGFTQINIVYWTLLAVPLLLSVYNVKQVPPVRHKAPAAAADPAEGAEEKSTPGAAGTAMPGKKDAADAGEGVSPVKHAQLIALALKAPIVIAAPILITVVTDLILRLQK